MNIYEMAVWIRQNDPTAMRQNVYLIDFLEPRHLSREITSKAYFNMLRDIMINVLLNSPYPEEIIDE